MLDEASDQVGQSTLSCFLLSGDEAGESRTAEHRHHRVPALWAADASSGLWDGCNPNTSNALHAK